MSRGRALAGNLALAAATLVVTIMVAELALRVVGYAYSPLHIEIIGGDARVQHVFEDGHFEYDAELIWRPRAGRSVFNLQGFRGADLEQPKPTNAYRIFTVGDSNTLGWAGDRGPNWPQYLGELLADAGGVTIQDSDQPAAVTVTNAGVWGYTAFQGYRRFQQTLQYEPDMVLVSFGANDAHRVAYADSEFELSRLRSSRLDQMLSRVRLGHVLLALLDRSSATVEADLRPRVGLDSYRDLLTAMVREARERDIRVVLLTRPYIGAIRGPMLWKNFARDYAVATAEVAAAESVPLIDIYSVFREQEELFEDESHFTEEGHRRAARAVYEAVRTELWRAGRWRARTTELDP